jgi:hypothetical protein
MASLCINRHTIVTIHNMCKWLASNNATNLTCFALMIVIWRHTCLQMRHIAAHANSCCQLFSKEHRNIISTCFICFASKHQLVLKTTGTNWNEMFQTARKWAVTVLRGTSFAWHTVLVFISFLYEFNNYLSTNKQDVKVQQSRYRPGVAQRVPGS